MGQLSRLSRLTGINRTAYVRAPSSLLTGIVSYWKLDEASGTRLDSVPASANDLTSNNAVGQAAGLIGNAAQFTAASSQYLSHASNSSLQTGSVDFTVAAWVYLSTLGINQQVVSKDTDTSREFNLEIRSNNKADFQIKGGFPSPAPVVSSVTLSASTWYLLVGWLDTVAQTINIQVNNGTVNSLATGETVPTAGGTALEIGARPYPGNQNYFDGRIQLVGFWKSAPGGGGALTSTQRTNLYNAGAGVVYPFAGVP